MNLSILIHLFFLYSCLNLIACEGSDNGIAVATIASLNHLYRVRVFFASVELHSPAARHLLLVDRNDDAVDFSKEHFSVTEVLDLPTLSNNEITKMLDVYNIMEANNNFKGAYLRYLLNELSYSKVLLFDPDVFIISSLNSLFKSLNKSCSIITTPHAVEPIPSNAYSITDKTFLQVGTLNLGFIGVRRSSRTNAFLNWWQQKLKDEGYYDAQNGLFSDQKWMDLVFSYFGDVHCTLRNKGLNIAYWNLHERAHAIQYNIENNSYTVGADPFVFFHFSSWNTDVDEMHISKFYSLKYSLKNVPQLIPLFREYRALVSHELMYRNTLHMPYAFAKEIENENGIMTSNSTVFQTLISALLVVLIAITGIRFLARRRLNK